jgi:formamidopyrimidine-DNA glycosylase
MPELPEVETARRGIEPHVTGRTLAGAVVRDPRLRWPVPPDLHAQVRGRHVASLRRRGKYILADLGDLHLLLHLGMSGSVSITPAGTPPRKHDHVDILLGDGYVLRLHDPRRFGAMLLVPGLPEHHPLLRGLGPEPLDPTWSGRALWQATRGRSAAIKRVIMDARTVVGVGNIYASEALFRAGIRPGTAARRLSRPACARLVAAIRETLEEALAAGGSSLRDYVQASGDLGCFQLEHRVYGRGGASCVVCGCEIRLSRIGQRSSFWCPNCQR